MSPPTCVVRANRTHIAVKSFFLRISFGVSYIFMTTGVVLNDLIGFTKDDFLFAHVNEALIKLNMIQN